MNHLRNSTIWLVVAMLFVGCGKDDTRKIKLASEESGERIGVQTGASVLQVSLEDQRSIAIFNFHNATGDAKLDWLRRGLTDMLVAELAQSPFINVVPVKRLAQIAERLGKSVSHLADQGVARLVAREAHVEAMLTGRLSRDAEGLRIDAELREVSTGKILRRETVRGPSLERIFVMVNELSEQVRGNLRGDLEASRVTGVDLRDMTQSVEAFRCYSEALDNLDKFLYAQADDWLRQAIELDSTFAAAYLRLAGLKYRIGDKDAAVRAVSQARRYFEKLSEPDRITLRILEARDLEGMANISELIPSMQELLRFSPYDIDTRMQLAILLFGWQDFDRAVDEYKTVLELDPERKIAYNQLGYAYAYRGDFATAMKYLEKYQELAPDEHNPYDSMGEVLMWAGRLEEAAKSFETALAKLPSFYQSAWNLTEVYSELGDFERALKYSDKAIVAAPSARIQAISYGQRAYLYWRFGKIKEAVNASDIALESDPSMFYLGLKAGEMYKAIGDAAAARKVYKSLFDQYKAALAERKYDYTIYDEDALGFLLEADLPQVEVIRTLEGVLETDVQGFERETYLACLNTLYLRAGEYEKAGRSSFNLKKFYELLARLPSAGRGSGWKYMVEGIRLDPRQDVPDYTEPTQLLEVAQSAGRKDLEIIGHFAQAQIHAKYDRKQELAAAYRELGAPLEHDWLIVGPFQNRSGFHREYPPENSIDISATYESAGQEIHWQPAVDGAYDGYVDLREVLKRSTWAVGYGVVYVNSPEKRVVQLRVGTDEAAKLWLNNELLWQNYRKQGARLDEHMVTVALRAGDNKLLIKVTNTDLDWGFYLRVTDENGEGYPDLKFHPPTGTEDELVSR
ncbi:MAG: tetratricopeptide repeat protein [Bacteroidota bacterium]